MSHGTGILATGPSTGAQVAAAISSRGSLRLWLRQSSDCAFPHVNPTCPCPTPALTPASWETHCRSSVPAGPEELAFKSPDLAVSPRLGDPGQIPALWPCFLICKWENHSISLEGGVRLKGVRRCKALRSVWQECVLLSGTMPLSPSCGPELPFTPGMHRD